MILYNWYFFCPQKYMSAWGFTVATHAWTLAHTRKRGREIQRERDWGMQDEFTTVSCIFSEGRKGSGSWLAVDGQVTSF